MPEFNPIADMGGLGSQDYTMYRGLDGTPFRTRNGAPPMYKSGDPVRKQPQQVVDIHVNALSMADDKDVKELQRILDMCAKGRGYVSSIDKSFDDESKNWKVLLIWGEYFLEDPKETEENAARTIY